MPTKELSPALDEAIDDSEAEGFFFQGQERVLDFVCRAIRADFGVSYQAMQTRIRSSKLWPHAKVANLPKSN